MDLSSLLTVAAAMNNVEGEPAWTTVVITGLVLVFGVLVLLYLLITLEGVVFTSIDNKKKGVKPAEKKAAPAPAVAPKSAPQAAARVPAPVVEAGIPGGVVAAITAAIACMEGGSNYTLRSLKRAKTGRSAWSQAGVVSYTEPF